MEDTLKKSTVEFISKIPNETYSIGVFEGSSLFDLSPSKNCKNPILHRGRIPGDNMNFVADPFALYHEDKWYLFYEKMELDSRKGKICVVISDDGFTWTQSMEVLEESFHLSYPQVFKNGDDFYMIPESYEANEIRLYKSKSFPFDWNFEKVILPISSVDSTIFFKDNLWWLFVCDAPKEHNKLRLFYSEDLYSEWTEHDQSPIIENDNRISRPAGKILEYGGKIYRFAQDCSEFYGQSVHAIEIEILNKNEYRERELDVNPILSAGDESWNKVSMHHLDLHKNGKGGYIAFVDGRTH